MSVVSALDRTQPGHLRAERERHLKFIEEAAGHLIEAKALETVLEAKKQELALLTREVRRLSVGRQQALRKAIKEVSSKMWLRQNPPPWIADRLKQITVALDELRIEFGPQHRREEWLKEKLRTLASDAKRSERKALTDALDDVQAELEAYSTKSAALKEERSQLLKRCEMEAWPEPAAE